jgi:4-hydroxy-3-methylbut-2-en-1-yl diphosphate reductase
MKIHLSSHYGMCFGVRDALRATHNAALQQPVTVLGQLAHNPLVINHLRSLGVRQHELQRPLQMEPTEVTKHVIITAHCAAERDVQAWRQAGHTITDTTCPLVKKAHMALAQLVEEGYHPIIIGQREHVEVRGLTGDYPQAQVVLDEADIQQLSRSGQKLGILSQTTQPLERVLQLVEKIKAHVGKVEVRFIDTVCRPTKQRQAALEDLCQHCQLILVIGGKNSNNTRQLTEKAQRLGTPAIQIENATELQATWFQNINHVGITAGTSTLDETVRSVVDCLTQMVA